MGTRTRLVTAGIVALVLASQVPAVSGAGAEGAEDPVIVVRYTGTLDAYREPMGENPRGPDLHEAHYRWGLVWRGRLSQIKKNAAYRFETERLTGTIKYVDRIQGPNSDIRNDCGGTFVAKPGTKVPLTVTFNPDNKGGIGVQVRRPVSGDYLVSTNKKSNWQLCTLVWAGLLPGKRVLPPIFYFALSGGTRTNTVSHQETVLPKELNRTFVKETVTVGGADSEPGPDLGTPPGVKEFFRRDLVRAVERAKAPCVHLVVSAVLTGAGVLFAPGATALATALTDISRDMFVAWRPDLCNEYLRQIVQDYTVIKRDPPLPQATPSPRLPSCARWQGEARLYCERLRAAVTTLVASEHEVLPALKQLAGASAKLVAALKSGNEQALKDAQASVNKLASRVRSTRTASSAAGTRLASVMKAAGVRGELTKAQSAATIEALVSRLAKLGVPAADLRRIAGAALSPTSIDILTTLQR